MKALGRIATMLSATLMATPLAACSSHGNVPSSDGSEQATESAAQQGQEANGRSGEQSQIANPFVDCTSAYEASQLAGFTVTFPESVPGYAERRYQAIEGQLVQCFYGNEDDHVLIRKAKGHDDISGDYGEYRETKEVGLGELTLTEKGDGELVHVVTWQKDGFTYAIDAAAGLEPGQIEGLVETTI